MVKQQSCFADNGKIKERAGTMLNIGIETQQGLVYEGAGRYGRAIWPTPIITPAKIVFASEGPLKAEGSHESITQACRFREDVYDPIARIRRGRFYFAEGTQPTEWYVQPHPALPYERAEGDKHDLTKRLENFHGKPIWYDYIKGRREQPLVLLGRDDRFTVWTIINVEAIATGEDLVTLKARSSLGVLPVVSEEKIPASFRAGVLESLSAFADEVHRSAPVSVIDRARDAASHILLAYFDATGKDAKDLSEMVKPLDDKKLVIAASAAKIIARLHARAKPVEREKRTLRAIREEDAQLATQCVGTILCELKWADWP